MSHAPTTITIDLDVKCAECKKGGAMASGICMRCATKVLQGKAMKSAQGQAVKRRVDAGRKNGLKP